MRKILILIIILFSSNFVNAAFLYDSYHKIYVKNENNVLSTGLDSSIKLAKNFNLVVDYETYLKSIDIEQKSIQPRFVDFKIGFETKIDSIIVGFKHSCYHSIDEFIETNKAVPRNRVFLEF